MSKYNTFLLDFITILRLAKPDKDIHEYIKSIVDTLEHRGGKKINLTTYSVDKINVTELIEKA